MSGRGALITVYYAVSILLAILWVEQRLREKYIIILNITYKLLCGK
jgi:hypothetical protein